ncbi:succinate-semialdehyde dehydrogenase [Ophiostoma piceae UAMH 11346]|uniref:succinate-semialdehyde dehydrogenase [NAD(P)(+)] n=1 Tax=Ophiostoma piceae (strain UAMH 11346) TaxID=1262450 RepID=S3CBL1_OPHP1|nr:succinate-semialdehyde dehydrogenase [Ophiostoma piceae UAMH 11346]
MSLPFTLERPSLLQQKCYVDGQWVEAASGAQFSVVDPGTGKDWAAAPDCAAVDAEVAVKAAQKAFKTYSKIGARARSECLFAWSALIQKYRDDIATIITYETGKPVADARFEVDYSIQSARWFAGEAERIQGSAFDAALPGKKVLTLKQPIGVVAALVPWNLPVAMVARKAGAAMAAGCTMVVKPSPETPLSVLTLALLAEEAGFPKGVLNVITTSLDNTPAVSEALCHHPDVKKVTFTGSTRVGKLVARMCADGLKKLTLELGGNCPFLVFDDADLDQAADALSSLKWRNAGQICVNANRVYVQSGVYDKFAKLVCERAGRLVVGHGGHAATPTTPIATIGPVTTPQSLDRALAQVDDAKQNGAQVLLGGARVPNLTGFFLQPTIIGDATKAMRVADEESFAPIMTLFKFDEEEEAINAANNTPMGLASYVFTKDVDRSWRMMEELEAGMIGLNTSAISGVEAPFGGIKESGYGKEAGKDVAVEEYLITKAVSVALVSRL